MKLFQHFILHRNKMSGFFTKRFALICCAVLFYCSNTCAGDTCKVFQLVKNHLNKNMIGHDILELEVTSQQNCARKCFNYKSCKSFGFHRNELSCKLKDTDSDTAGETEFEIDAGTIFSDISEWPSTLAGNCAQRPCSENQRCLDSNDGFQCIDITCDSDSVPTVDHGVLVPNSLSTNATVTCEDGYETFEPIIQCQVSGKWEEGASCVEKGDSDCRDIIDNNPFATSGTYTVKLWNSRKNLTIYCDMETEGGGWTMFHNRFDGTVEFYRVFSEYENGFGDINGEFWLGLKHIQEIADQGATEIRLEVMRNNGEKGFETYQDFQLLDGTDYKLSIDTASAVRSTDTGSTASISHTVNFAYTNGQPFTSFDNITDYNCATERHAAWWFSICTYVNLNGRYCEPGTYCNDGNYGLSGHHHKGFGTADTEALKASRMLMRRV